MLVGKYTVISMYFDICESFFRVKIVDSIVNGFVISFSIIRCALRVRRSMKDISIHFSKKLSDGGSFDELTGQHYYSEPYQLD